MRLPPWFAPSRVARTRKRFTCRRCSVGRFDRSFYCLLLRNLHDGRFIFDAVDEQNPVEMVDLMLEDACAPAAGLDADRPVVEACPLDRHYFGARHFTGPTGDAQASLVTEDPTVCPDDLRVDQGNRELRTAFVVEVFLYVDPDQSAQYADLWRRQAHSGRGQHCLVH